MTNDELKALLADHGIKSYVTPFWGTGTLLMFRKLLESQAMTAKQRRHMEIGRALEDACLNLPEGCLVEVGAERGSGWVTAYDMAGEEIEKEHECETMAEQIDHAVELAKKWVDKETGP